jgi:transposase
LRNLLCHPPSTHAYRRALALLAVDQGETIASVADRLGVSRQSVYNWVAAYLRAPSASTLLDRYAGGRPTLWTADLRALLARALRTTPARAGLAGPHWTVPLLQAYLEHHGDTPLSDDTIRRELQRLGYVWKRFRYVLPPDPELEKKTPDPVAAAAAAATQRQAV